MAPSEAATPEPRRKPGRPRLRAVADERRLILDSARRLFAERGFDGASVDAVARRAGVARPSVYEHFANKEELGAAVVEDAAELMTTVLGDAFAAPADTPWEQVVRRGFEATFQLIADHADVVTVLLLAERSGAFPPGSGMALARQRVIADIAERGRDLWRQRGAEIGRSSEIVAMMLYGMAEPVAVRHLQEGWDPTAVIELLTTFTTSGLAGLWEQDLRHLRAFDATNPGTPPPVDQED